MSNESSGCPVCGKSVKHIQSHVKAVHPEHYTPQRGGRRKKVVAPAKLPVARKKASLPPIDTDGVVTTVLRAICGPVVAVEHVPAIVRWSQATDEFLSIVQAPKVA